MDAITPAIAAFKVGAKQLLTWRRHAEAAAETREGKDAAATLYFAGLLLAAIGTLDRSFTPLETGIVDVFEQISVK